ncbi:crossover junction endonuclease MUS81 [Zootermopsis nevadensis]|uniref:Crossover junction endonuclease MUS81 n=1 Tax=Zootermopsis nevadensis TaxID=136037 RepID=A0A067R1A1_ZOONE|nr:crossover junction endonuclease MUS81 [Zootermopsis nevadensis]XP_021927109.1 crossover junction endonuclease MUS81 [Zootermopsis nevadensis]KDR15724.1 Crossover junction endonuclease MUS81 [Zootermopsis nevadensis]
MAADAWKRGRKRVTLKYKKPPNPLFEKWLEEWKNEAASRGSDMQYCFAKALSSLRRFPLPLKSGRDCGILESFGNRLCIMLDRKLNEYRKTHPEGIGDRSDDIVTSVIASPVACSGSQSEPKRKNLGRVRVARNNKQYLPAWRSGPYAILLTLHEESQKPDYPGFLTKTELQTMAQPLCDTSFKKLDPGSFYTAWSCIVGLIKRGLVLRNGCPAKFSLTEAGADMAQQLRDRGSASPSRPLADAAPCNIPIHMSSNGHAPYAAASNIDVVNTHMSHDKDYHLTISVKKKDCKNSHPSLKKPSIRKCYKPPPRQQKTADDTVFLVPGLFDVILLVDKRETTGHSGQKHLEGATVAELSILGTLFEVRHLTVGDFIWVCRDRVTGQELVLPYIVERKRMDDLASSIQDGRFREQKFRMKQSGLQNLIYLVESHGDNRRTSLPLDTLTQAAINTQVVNMFTVKITSSHRNSMRYLSVMTRHLSASYCDKTFVSCHRGNLPCCHIRDDLISLMTFSEFNKSSCKTKAKRVQDLFMKQLLQLHGLSVEKVRAILEQYPTLRDLMAAYQAEGSAGEKLLASIRYGFLNRHIGPVISRAIHRFYTNRLL